MEEGTGEEASCRSYARGPFWNIVVGVSAAVVAALFGFIDWTGIPSNTRARRIGAVHGIGNVAATGMYFVAAYLRSDARSLPPPTAAFALEVGGLALVAVTSWLGGELVDRLGVGVDEGANVQAPSSLSDEAT